MRFVYVVPLLLSILGRVSRSVPTHRGWIRKLKFAPGRGNMKLIILFSDGVEVWDAKEVISTSAIGYMDT